MPRPIGILTSDLGTPKSRGTYRGAQVRRGGGCMKVCVTGGAGFIGSHLVDRLVRDGHEVVVLDNLSTGRLENLETSRSKLRLDEGDLRDRAAVAKALAGVEVVFHQAALASVARSVENPREVTEVNVGGTLNVLVAAKELGVRRVVFASSSSVYGDTPDAPQDRVDARDPALALRGLQGGGRGVPRGLPGLLRPRDGLAPVLQRVRAPAVGQVALRGGRPPLLRLDGGRQAADDPRRRRPDPRLHLRHRRGRRPRPRGDRAARHRGPDEPRRRPADLDPRPGEGDRRRPSASRAPRSTSRPASATCATRWPTSARRRSALGWVPATPLADGIAKIVSWNRARTAAAR